MLNDIDTDETIVKARTNMTSTPYAAGFPRPSSTRWSRAQAS